MEIDRASIRDLELFGIYYDGEFLSEKGVVSVFNLAQTKAGKKYIENYFSNPFSSIDKIRTNQQSLNYFVNNLNLWKSLLDELSYYEFDGVERYLSSNILGFYSPNFFKMKYKSSIFRIFYEDIIEEIISGILSVINLVEKAEKILNLLRKSESDSSLFIEEVNIIEKFFKLEITKSLKNFQDLRHNTSKVLKIDYQLRNEHIDLVKKLLYTVAKFDGLLGLAKGFIEHGLSFPEFVSEKPYIEAIDFYHPLLKKPVKNSIVISKENNFLFITGPNMGGKTTFLKALGLCVYLAHLGYGVPAKSFKLSVFDNLTTIINTYENITKGYSTFMAEVKKVKEIAKKVVSKKSCLILMDELFKGTNFEDACETTKAVILRMVKCKNSIFVLSTHLFEIAESIKDCKGILFKCFEAGENENEINYDYTLKDGVSRTKLGMKILKNEKILEIFDKEREQ
jgi:DNA mismatch repair ATPase MutS